MIKTVGFGGGCHWCTEAVFASLKGVCDVRQGWISATFPDDGFSEAVLVDFDPDLISLDVLIEIHVRTHSSTSDHSMRGKYRSAIYFLDEKTGLLARNALRRLEPEFGAPLITKALPFAAFRSNIAEQLNYYYTDPARPFCVTYIDPKLYMLMTRFREHVDPAKRKS